MNWKRGLFRSWIAFSLIWIGGVSIFAIIESKNYMTVMSGAPDPQGGVAQYPWQLNWTTQDSESCANARVSNPALGNPFACFVKPTYYQESINSKPDLVALIFFAATPPALMFFMGLVGRWIYLGFRK